MHSRTYIPEKQLTEDIKSDLPVPDNIRDVPKMDDFLSSMIAAANKNYVLEMNKDLERIQNKVRDITGPISYLWEKIERFRTGESNEAIDIEESALTMQEAMMLVGQASNAVTYQRRLEVLKGFTDVKTAKGMLGKHAEKLATEPTELFGKDFKSVLKTTSTSFGILQSTIKTETSLSRSLLSCQKEPRKGAIVLCPKRPPRFFQPKPQESGWLPR